MFLTKSIRRKLAFGLMLVVGMLGVLSLSGLWGLFSYRELVNDPAIDDRYSPSAADLTAAIADLKAALPSVDGSEGHTLDLPALQRDVDEARSICAAYQKRLSDLPDDIRPQHEMSWELVGQLQQGLDRLDQTIANPNPSSLDRIPLQVEHLLVTAVRMPDLPDRLRARLREARSDYRSGLILISVCSGVVFLLLIGLVRFVRRQILLPIKTLHQGAKRVAGGEFDYRVPSESDDEMGELAESFNKMTERFQSIASGLDRQVQERSKQLVRSERLASVGFLAAGVAHEVNNPLTAIHWTAESLEDRIAEILQDRSIAADEVAVIEQYLRMIQSEAERCQEITKKLLDFSRDHDSAKTQQDVARIIREVLKLITHMKKYRECRLTFDFDGSCLAEIAAHEIKQVLLNLVANSLDATNGDGTVRVELIEHVDEVEIIVTDDGCGMSADDLAQLFDPFYTTKPTGSGTGLGLSISHRIVAEHGGSIEAHSEGIGCGSRFTVRLPRQQTEKESPEERLAFLKQ